MNVMKIGKYLPGVIFIYCLRKYNKYDKVNKKRLNVIDLLERGV